VPKGGEDQLHKKASVAMVNREEESEQVGGDERTPPAGPQPLDVSHMDWDPEEQEESLDALDGEVHPLSGHRHSRVHHCWMLLLKMSRYLKQAATT
jgi:hypothetical protein